MIIYWLHKTIVQTCKKVSSELNKTVGVPFGWLQFIRRRFVLIESYLNGFYF